MAYQVAFDLFENEYQHFLFNVRDRLPDPGLVSSAAAAADGDVAAVTDQEVSTSKNESSSAMDTSEAETPLPTDTNERNELATEQESAEYIENLSKLKGILSGEKPISLTLQFLFSHNRYSCDRHLRIQNPNFCGKVACL